MRNYDKANQRYREIQLDLMNNKNILLYNAKINMHTDIKIRYIYEPQLFLYYVESSNNKIWCSPRSQDGACFHSVVHARNAVDELSMKFGINFEVIEI